MRKGRKIVGLVLARNEEVQIERCLLSLKKVCDEVWLIDNGSTDDTVTIGKSLGVRIVAIEGSTQGEVMARALTLLERDNGGEWLLRLDADEYIEEQNRYELVDRMKAGEYDENDSIALKRFIVSEGRVLRWGNSGKSSYRLVRIGQIKFDNSIMDERFLAGKSPCNASMEIFDRQLKGLDFFIEKHIAYSAREAKKAEMQGTKGKKLYYAMPRYARAFAYFGYIYIIKQGWRDGSKGLRYYLIQCLIYRLLVDIRIGASKTS